MESHILKIRIEMEMKKSILKNLSKALIKEPQSSYSMILRHKKQTNVSELYSHKNRRSRVSKDP
jgi:hypothetical protein